MPDAQEAWWNEIIRSAPTPDLATQRQDNFQRMQSFIASFRSGWFVSCWHRNEYENFAFWRIYGRDERACSECGRLVIQGGESVAVSTTFRRLEAALPAHIEVGAVPYLDYGTQGAELLNMFQYIMHKRRFYAYEAEIRAIASDSVATFPGIAGDHIRSNIVAGSYAPPVDIQNLIHFVVVHPEATSTFLAEIRALCDQNHLPAPILSGLA